MKCWMAAGLRALAWGTLAASRQPLVSPAILDSLKIGVLENM